MTLLSLQTSTAPRPRCSTLTWPCCVCHREFRAVALPYVEPNDCCSYACALRAEEGDE